MSNCHVAERTFFCVCVHVCVYFSYFHRLASRLQMPPKQVVKTGGKKVSNSAAKPPAAAKQVFGCLTHENTLVEKHVVCLFSLGRTSQATIMHTSQNKRRGCSNRGRQRGSEQGYRTESERWRLPFAVAVYPVKFVCGLLFFEQRGENEKSDG